LGVGRRADALAATAGQHPDIAAFPADLRADGAADAVVGAAVGRWGRIDVVVNNAGVTALMPLEGVSASRIAELLAINVTAPSLLASAALKHLRAVRGAIINVSSTFGHRPVAGAAHYAASKLRWSSSLEAGLWNWPPTGSGSTRSRPAPPKAMPSRRPACHRQRSKRSRPLRQHASRSAAAAKRPKSPPGSSASQIPAPLG
jgi:hypothetical protein